MGHIDTPSEGAVDLGAQFATDLIEVGVLPQIGRVSRKPSLAREQRWSVGDWTPAVDVMLGVQSQVHADVIARFEQLGGVAGPRGGNHDRGAGRRSCSEGVEHAEVGGVAGSQVVA